MVSSEQHRLKIKPWRVDCHCMIFVRYSILALNHSIGWKIAATSPERYRRKLFDAKRLAFHEYCFEHIVLASLAAQNRRLDPSWFTLCVLTSTELPEPSMQFLKRLQETRPWLRVLALPPEAPELAGVVRSQIAEHVKTPLYCTIRLDDDDALANNYFARLSRFLDPALDGSVISFANGYMGLCGGLSGFKSFRDLKQPKIALGLASVHSMASFKTGKMKRASIFETGRHTTIDERLPVVVDSRSRAFIRTVHPFSDNYRKVRRRWFFKTGIDAEKVKRHFPWIELAG